MSRLATLSSNPTLKTFAQGAAQSSVRKVADFIAPGVEVPSITGQYKSYTAKNRFRIPKTLRGVNGKATTVGFSAEDKTYNCRPHALDFPIDDLESYEGDQLLNMAKYGATLVADIAGLAHESTVINMALTAAGAGSDSNFAAADVDPVDVLDDAIVQVIKAARNGAPIRVLFGAQAWLRTKKNSKLKSRLIANRKSDVGAITLENFRSLLFAEPECEMSILVQDTAPEGVADNVSFLLDNSILVFASNPSATTLDPSFMKTFRLMGQWMKPGAYRREDDRGEVLKMDWSEDVQVTNSEAVIRINANVA